MSATASSKKGVGDAEGFNISRGALGVGGEKQGIQKTTEAGGGDPPRKGGGKRKKGNPFWGLQKVFSPETKETSKTRGKEFTGSGRPVATGGGGLIEEEKGGQTSKQSGQGPTRKLVLPKIKRGSEHG